MYVCDECCSKFVAAGKARPLSEIHGDAVPKIDKAICQICGQKKTVYDNPDIED